MGHSRRRFHHSRDTSTLNATQEKELKKNKQKNSKALFTLQQAVTDAIFPRIMGAKTAKEAWNTFTTRKRAICDSHLGAFRLNPPHQGNRRRFPRRLRGTGGGFCGG